MVKDHSDSERGNLLLPHGLLPLISSKGSFICIIPPDRIIHTTAFVTPVVEPWLERDIAQWVHHEGSIRRNIKSQRSLTTKNLSECHGHVPLLPQTTVVFYRQYQGKPRQHKKKTDILLASYVNLGREIKSIINIKTQDQNKGYKRTLFNKAIQYTNFG